MPPRIIAAIYENGVFRPLQPVELKQFQRVRLTILEPTDPQLQEEKFAEQARAHVATLDYIPTIEELHKITSKIPGSLSDAFIADREERY